MESPIDKAGQPSKAKNEGQYKKLNPDLKGGEIGTRSSTSEAMKIKKPGKLFKGD